MNINIKNIVTLDDKCEYLVVSKIQNNKREYFYMVDINNNSNFKICYLDNDSMVEVTNKDMLKALIVLFGKQVENDIIS